LRVITDDDHVINIYKKKGPPMRRIVNKESTVVITGFEASIDDDGGEALKPGTRSLLEPIERTLQTTNHDRRSRQQSTLDTASCRPPHILHHR
jgi:hypothetical protein